MKDLIVKSRRNLFRGALMVPVALYMVACQNAPAGTPTPTTPTDPVSTVSNVISTVVSGLTTGLSALPTLWPQITGFVSQIKALGSNLSLANVASAGTSFISLVSQLAEVAGPLIPGVGTGAAVAGTLVQGALAVIPLVQQAIADVTGAAPTAAAAPSRLTPSAGLGVLEAAAKGLLVAR